MISKRKQRKIVIKRIIGICLTVIILSGLCATAANTRLNKVKIICSNNYEMTTMTSKTKVSEILEDNHIIILPEEKVEPGLDEEIDSSSVIRIFNKTEEEKVVEIAENTSDISEKNIKDAYNNIVEKRIVEQETIPFETITKDISNSSEETTNKVLKQGQEGLKEVVYRAKFQNDIEIEGTRVKESETIIKEPVDKVVQVKAKATNRSSESRSSVNDAPSTSTSKSSLAAKVEGKTPTVKTMNMSAYTASTCGKSASSAGYGVTSSGAKASSWYTVAAGKGYPIGTIIYIPYFQNKPNGGWFVVQDRGGAISNNRIDVYMGTYNECINFGRRNLECYIYN